MGREGGGIAGGETGLIIGPGEGLKASLNADHCDAAIDRAD